MPTVSAFRLFSVIGLSLVTGAVALESAQADRAICSTLKRQLVSAPNGSMPAPNRAAQQQTLQIQQTRAKAKQAGCGGFFLSRGNPAVCRRYDQMIARMSAKLGQLQRGSVRTQGPSRQQILASLDANGCNDTQVATRDDRPYAPRRTLFDILFGVTARYSPPGSQDRRSIQRRPRTPSSETLVTSYEGTDPGENIMVKKGGYRTLCVRTCDGYYFPISFSSQPRDFVRDQNACTAMCPAAKAQLYYHAVPEEESEDMVSVVDQKPYSELPNAFNYRTVGLRAVPGCACHSRPSLPKFTPAPAPIASNAFAVLPTGKKAPDESDAGEPDVEREYVRVVGPAFFPDQEKSIDLKTPPPDAGEPRHQAGILTPGNIVRTITSDILRRFE